MSEYTKIADAADLPPGTAMSADSGGAKVALFRSLLPDATKTGAVPLWAV